MKKRILACILASMTVLSLASCGDGDRSSTASANPVVSETESESSVSETSSSGYTPNFEEDPYTVHFMYWVASDSSGQQEVADAVNELALSEMNMEVDLFPITYGSYFSTISTTLAANDALDLFPDVPRYFGTNISSGYVRNWADYLDYIPDVTADLGQYLDAGYVGDFLVGIPGRREFGLQSGLIIRKDIMDAVGYSPDDFACTTEDYSSYDKITELFAAIHEAYPEMIVTYGSLPATFGNLNDNLGDNFGVLEDFGRTTTITNWFESEQCLTFAKISRQWHDAGYFSADAATTSDSNTALMKAGNLASFINNIKPNTDIEKGTQTGHEVYVIPLSQAPIVSSSTINSFVYSLANASEDPAKAAAFYNWAYTNSEFENLINWGIEGKDWVVDENGMATFPEGVDSANVSYHQDWGWSYPNQFIGHAWVGNDPDIWQQYEELTDEAIRSEAFGFTYDSTSVSDYLSACTAVYDKYDNDLYYGSFDPETHLAALNEELYAAGLQTIMDEKQRQLDAWLESKK